MSGAEFHPLVVKSVERLTDEAVAVEFSVPDELAEQFDFVAGEHVVLRAEIDGVDVRRSYSLCVPAGSGRVRVGIKQIPDGLFSTFATKELKTGDVLEVATPTGDFTLTPEAGTAHSYCAIAAGSGITPVLSMIATVLGAEPESRFTLLYGNRHGGSIMFLEELAELKDRYLDRFSVFHVLSRESTDIPLFEGRLNRGKIEELVDAVVPVDTIDRWLLCGPLGVVEAAQEALLAGGIPEGAIGRELFFDERVPETPRTIAGDESGALVRFSLAGRTSEIRVDPSGPPILDYVLSVRDDAPFSCRNGACASCRAIVTSGAVSMHHNWALTDAEVAAGQVLTCQSHPETEDVELTFDI